MNASPLYLLDLDDPRERGPSDPWAIVLAGGNGHRLSDEAVRRYGYARPKQFCAFDERGTLLDQTLRRAQPLVAPDRMVVVTTRAHRAEARECLGSWWRVRNVEQPCNEETTPGIILPLVHVLAEDPDATVVILPSDHHVADDAAFRAVVRQALEMLHHDPTRVVLLGVAPDQAQEGYGWIVPEPLADAAWAGVRSFREKPPLAEADQLWRQGALLNTFVMVARGRALGRLCRRHAPQWWRALTHSAFRPNLLDAAYNVLPSSNFSTDVLERGGDLLRVVGMRNVGWSDVGTPDRLYEALRARRGAA